MFSAKAHTADKNPVGGTMRAPIPIVPHRPSKKNDDMVGVGLELRFGSVVRWMLGLASESRPGALG